MACIKIYLLFKGFSSLEKPPFIATAFFVDKYCSWTKEDSYSLIKKKDYLIRHKLFSYINLLFFFSFIEERICLNNHQVSLLTKHMSRYLVEYVELKMGFSRLPLNKIFRRSNPRSVFSLYEKSRTKQSLIFL